MLTVTMISTTDLKSGRRDLLERMLASVASFRNQRPDIGLSLLILAQNADTGVGEPEWPAFARIDRMAGRASLSAARNRLLATARANRLVDQSTIVLFPDDDCWYPPGALAGIHSVFTERPDLDLWFCRYGSTPVAFEAASPIPAVASTVTRRASSNTIAVRGHLVADGLAFDEELGVGTANGGGEDTAFALAAFGRARQALFHDAACIGHRDADPAFVARYYRGALLALAGHLQVAGVPREFLRKLAVGIYLIGRGRLQPTAYAAAVAASMRVRRDAG